MKDLGQGNTQGDFFTMSYILNNNNVLKSSNVIIYFPHNKHTDLYNQLNCRQ